MVVAVDVVVTTVGAEPKTGGFANGAALWPNTLVVEGAVDVVIAVGATVLTTPNTVGGLDEGVKVNGAGAALEAAGAEPPGKLKLNVAACAVPVFGATVLSPRLKEKVDDAADEVAAAVAVVAELVAGTLGAGALDAGCSLTLENNGGDGLAEDDSEVNDANEKVDLGRVGADVAGGGAGDATLAGAVVVVAGIEVVLGAESEPNEKLGFSAEAVVVGVAGDWIAPDEKLGFNVGAILADVVVNVTAALGLASFRVRGGAGSVLKETAGVGAVEAAGNDGAGTEAAAALKAEARASFPTNGDNPLSNLDANATGVAVWAGARPGLLAGATSVLV